MEQITELSDRDLFVRFVENNKSETLFREIMKRYKSKVYWQARRLVIKHDDADEITQMVFIKLWKSAETFQYKSALSSFIFRITYNESITLLKQKQRLSSFDDLLDKDGHYKDHIESGNEMSGDEISKRLQMALLKLPEKQRIVFQYRYYEELSYEEISEITGTSEGALKASYHFASEKIKKILELV